MTANPAETTLLERLLQAARSCDYAGYNKHDALLSPLLLSLMGRTRLARLVAIQLVMRAPINLRSLLGVPRTRNPKGIGLFAFAYLLRYECSRKPQDLEQARELLQWLHANRSRTHTGLSWGYQYPWQDVGFFAPAFFPNRVVTCWIGHSFFKAWQVTGNEEYLEICNEICQFLLDAPGRIVDTDNELCLSYVPDPTVSWAVMDVSALCARMLALTGKQTGNDRYLREAARCINYVLKRQTDYGAWYYTDPPSDSTITHDNYHTGIILDCLLDYATTTGNESCLEGYNAGLSYYARNLFTPDGAPKWMNTVVWPHDIHGAAQGIISFSKAAALYPEYENLARKICAWTLKHLYDTTSGFFWYQKTRFFTRRFTLMRWCNAWMAVALATRRANNRTPGE